MSTTLYQHLNLNKEQFRSRLECEILSGNNTYNKLKLIVGGDQTSLRKYVRMFNLEHMIEDRPNLSLQEKLKISDDELVIQLREYLDQDYSMPKIAKLYQVSPTAVFNYMKKFSKRRKPVML
jgi:transposase-like protein